MLHLKLNEWQGMDNEDILHCFIGVFLLLLSAISFRFSFPVCFTLLLVIALLIYIVLILVQCALRARHGENEKRIFELPNRTWALLIALCMVLTNVFTFSNIYHESETITYISECAIPQKITKWDSIYFSTVTLTTLGDNAFTVTPNGRKFVIFQLFSGIMLLIVILPLVISRISSFDEERKREARVTG